LQVAVAADPSDVASFFLQIAIFLNLDGWQSRLPAMV
jgi:hypothetical protein